MPLSFKALQAILSTNPDYLNQDGSLDSSKLHKLVQSSDASLIALLLSHQETKATFFIQQGNHSVFLRDKLIDYISHKDFLANSYTRYKNKIGLHDGTNYLKKTNDVVLNFPFKDCILEGGQIKDDDKQGEVYLNEVLAYIEIDRLFDKKVFTSAKKYTSKGQQSIATFNRDENGVIKDNLIIKGNNLIALHSIKHQFRGKVKLIYIDPPYNTGNDSFNYNDHFNHSTWLVFMKNRLEVAKELLRDDGVIFVSCDHHEQAYLKVLMDEVFGRENFIVNFVWETKKGAQGIVTKNMVVNNHENLIVFSKTENAFSFRGLEREEADFANPDHDPRGKWKRQYLQRFGQNFSQKTIVNPQNKMTFTFETPYSQEKLDQWITEGYIIFPDSPDQYPARKEFLKDYKNKKQCVSSLGLYSTKAGTEELYKLFDNQKVFKNPKPEKLISFIIEQSTLPNDIVLDFHLGSGTTAAVAHKMGRQYIGIEQMDYIEQVAVERLRKVIDGEQGAVSKSVEWQGGGEFIYLELKKYNQHFVEQIQQAQTTKELLEIRKVLLEKGFIDYRLNVEAIKANDQEFKKITLEQQKQILFEFLDKNQLYVNYSERKDETHSCTDEEKELSKKFYEE